MVAMPKLSRRARWAVPAGVLVVTGGVLAGSLISVAQASPGLAPRTPAQLLAQVADSTTPPLTGTVVETASLGLPSLPGTSSPTSIASLLTGSHTVNVWYAGPRHFRLAVPSQLSETDLITDGDTAWLWQSTASSVTEYALPAQASAAQAEPTASALTPQQAAQQVLAAVGPTTTVSVDSNVTVAGQPAYQLVLAPKDSRSLVGQVQIAVDGRNGVPLRLQVYARGADSPAFQVGYTAIQFATPAAAELTFTPPPGAQVTKESLDGSHASSGTQPAVTTIGSGWLAVLDVPSSAGLTGAGDKNAASSGTSGDSGAVLNALLGSASQVSGSWGSGRLLQTSLVSALIISNGPVLIGAVQPSVLYAAAAHLP
jgi:outer membrane lipoprotein-sorting protein